MTRSALRVSVRKAALEADEAHLVVIDDDPLGHAASGADRRPVVVPIELGLVHVRIMALWLSGVGAA